MGPKVVPAGINYEFSCFRQHIGGSINHRSVAKAAARS